VGAGGIQKTPDRFHAEYKDQRFLR
jgi:hypothetical protein